MDSEKINSKKYETLCKIEKSNFENCNSKTEFESGNVYGEGYDNVQCQLYKTLYNNCIEFKEKKSKKSP